MEELAPKAILRNYAKDPLKRQEVLSILKAAPSIEAVMNGRHKTAHQSGWKEKAPSKAVFTAAVLKEPNLFKRPITLHGNELVVGRSLVDIRELLS